MKIGNLYRRAADPEQRQGTKKALLIGINYVNQPCFLRGCHRDALAIRDLLIGETTANLRLKYSLTPQCRLLWIPALERSGAPG